MPLGRVSNGLRRSPRRILLVNEAQEAADQHQTRARWRERVAWGEWPWAAMFCRPRAADHPFSVTVVLGERWACPFVTYRPLIALRYAFPEPLFEPDSTTDVRGERAAAALDI